MKKRLLNSKPFLARKKESVAKLNVHAGVESFELHVNSRRPSEAYLNYVLSLLPRRLKNFPWSLKVWVKGGGITSQKLAVVKACGLAISRLLPSMKSEVKSLDYCWFDNRIVERKLYGGKKARARFQWVKR